MSGGLQGIGQAEPTAPGQVQGGWQAVWPWGYQLGTFQLAKNCSQEEVSWQERVIKVALPGDNHLFFPLRDSGSVLDTFCKVKNGEFRLIFPQTGMAGPKIWTWQSCEKNDTWTDLGSVERW